MKNKEQILFDTARLIKVIETTLTRRGEGKDYDPIRVVRQYWNSEGNLLAEVDPVRDDTNEESGAMAEITVIVEEDGKLSTALRSRVNGETFKFDKRFNTHYHADKYCRHLIYALSKIGFRIMMEKQ